MKKQVQLIVATCFALITFSECAVSYRVNDIDIPIEAQTVSVALFNNVSPLAPPEFATKITEDLQMKFRDQTRLDLAKGNGDLQFKGTVVNYAIQAVDVQNNNGISQSATSRLNVTLKIEYFNTIQPEKNFEKNISQFEEYPSSRTLQEVEQELWTELNKKLTTDIFNAAFNDW